MEKGITLKQMGWGSVTGLTRHDVTIYLVPWHHNWLLFQVSFCLNVIPPFLKYLGERYALLKSNSYQIDQRGTLIGLVMILKVCPYWKTKLYLDIFWLEVTNNSSNEPLISATLTLSKYLPSSL